MMDIEKIKQHINNPIYYFEELASTQDYAKKKENIENGAIVITDNQINGRGTHGRSWYTHSDKNITITITFKPMCEINKIDGLTVKIAKIIKEVIYNLYNYELEIKEPNDLILNGKKICGILTECSTKSGIVKKIYLGIGVNVNQEKFSGEIKEIATSLKKEFNKNFHREEIIIEIIKRLNRIIPNGQNNRKQY